MGRACLFACYAGLIGNLTASEFSTALSIRSAAAGSQENRLHSKLLVSVEQTPPTAEDKTDGEV